MLAQAGVDRLTSTAHELVIEGHRALLATIAAPLTGGGQLSVLGSGVHLCAIG